MKTLKLSPLSQADTYDCQFDWPDNCSVQAGDSGIVFIQGSRSYTTAFFEAFPPDTFIRGEGATVALAELDAWQQFSRIRQCAHPEFERRGYENGAGFCTQCGMFKSDVFPPSKTCVICGEPTYWSLDTDGNVYCEAHDGQKPLDKWTKGDWFLAYDEYEMWREKQNLERVMDIITDLIALLDQVVHLDAGLVQATGPLGQYNHGFFVERDGNQFPFRPDEVDSVDLATTPPTIHLVAR